MAEEFVTTHRTPNNETSSGEDGSGSVAASTDEQDESDDLFDEPTPQPRPVNGLGIYEDDGDSILPASRHDSDESTSQRSVISKDATLQSQTDGGAVARTGTIPAIKKFDRRQSDASRLQNARRMHRFSLYETHARFFITGADVTDQHFRILKIDRTAPPGQLSLFEDDIVYDKKEITQLLAAIDEGNKATGGLRHKINFWGLLGFVRLTDSYYMMLVTKRQQAAMLGGHYLYQIEATELVSLNTGIGSRYSQARNAEEARFLGILNNLDLSKNFYFSYSYNITRSLQENIIKERNAALSGDKAHIRDYNDMFIWNHHLLSPADKSLNNVYDWCVPIIHGFIDQSSINVFGRLIYLTIIGRRSRFFAGARFLKRGINDLGYVANDVETEQIVSEMLTTSFHAPGPRLFSNPTYTSYVHHRGSIPLYWTQDNSGVTPKPAIDLNMTDPFYQSAASHFDNLFQRYGCPIYVLNLIKARERTPRESKLLNEFKYAIDYLNQFLPDSKRIVYKAFDMSRASKTRGGDVIGNLEKIAEEILNQTDFFHNGDAVDEKSHVQNGVARTNCIDCLDRTNAAQFVIGKHALGLQLQALGVIQTPYMEYDSDAIDIFTHMFHNHGDTIAVQYGGSHLVNTMATYRKINHWQGHGRDMVESFKRYYHNSFLDSQRQEAYNLFLGNYIYTQGQPMLWDLATDYYLHHSDPKRYLDRTRGRKSYIDWFHPEHLEPRVLPPSPYGSVLSANSITENDEFWLEYYRPLVLSSFLKVYSYRMTANNRFLADRPTATIAHNPSPFVSRLDPNRVGPDSPEKKTRKGVTIIDPDSSTEINEKTALRSPQHNPAMVTTTPASATSLHHPSAAAAAHETPGPAAAEEKSLMNQWTLNKIYENSLNPSVTTNEAAEYERYIAHPSNIPLVVSDDAVRDSEVADQYAAYCGLPVDVVQIGTESDWDEMAEYADFIALAGREDALTVFDEDRDKKRYKAYRQWLVKGKSLFKQSKVDPEYRL
ncbi:hypothetical protein ANO11243_013140 [Dothideomycetidae sp. 11243]|nr:hypothetical protein ANO11243_013140 [fungal sp. No.11243]